MGKPGYDGLHEIEAKSARANNGFAEYSLMKASDTVMSDEQIGDRMIPAVSPFHSGKLLARVQAEISFKAGIKEASEVYNKYITLLGDELNEVVGLASIYGWRSSRVEDGIKCRKEIAKLKE